MSCLDKRHVTHGGGMQGHYKYTDGYSDTSSVGSFMDDTDREVSSLTDRAFRSLCIGDEAVYNDSEFASSPVERYEAFSLDAQHADLLKFNGQKLLSLGRKQNGGGAAAGAGEATVGATFQQSVLDMARKGLKNGAIDTAWQQSRSTFITGGGGTAAVSHQRAQVSEIKDFQYKKSSNDLWEKSALLNIRGELSVSGGHERGNFKPTKNHFHSCGDATAQSTKKDLETPLGKSSKSKRGKSSKPRKLSSKNFFLHSEHSPFESWRDRILLEQNHTPDRVPTNQRPMWYDSPLYKELTAEHGLQIPASKESEMNQSKSEVATVSPAPPPPSTPPPSTPPAAPPSSVVLQKATAIEKRSESESDASLPPWRRDKAQTRPTLPWSRPNTAAPCREREGQREEGSATMGRANGMIAAVGAAKVPTPIAAITSVTVVTPITSVTMVTPITSVTMVTPITSVTMVTPIKSVTPITSATVVTPAIAVTLVKAVTSVVALDEPVSSSSTPFSISQLLTPIIHTRQGTETSEVLQSLTLSPSSLDLDLSPSSFTDGSAKPANEVIPRNSYKAIASGLLFNLKDNRKRVKSTYSPTKFKIPDLSKQPSKPETAEPKNAPAISEVAVAETNTSLRPKASDGRPVSGVALESTDAQTVDHKKLADGGISDDYLTLSSPHPVKEAAAYRNFNSARENTPGKIRHAENGNGQYCGLERSKSDRTPLWERQGVNHPSLHLHKAASVTETVVPAMDVPVRSTAFKDTDRGIKETHSLRDRFFIKSAEVKHNEMRTGDNYRERGHNDSRDMQVNKQNEKSHVESVLSVKDKVELDSVEKYPKNLFAEQKRDSVKQGTLAKLDKLNTKEKSLASKEREKTQHRLTPVQEKQHERTEGRTNRVFSARQNQYIKNERYTIKDDDEYVQADKDNDDIATRYNSHVFTSEVLENNEHQNVAQGKFFTRDRHVAGDPEARKSHEAVLSQKDSEFVRNEIFANNRNGHDQQEVGEEAGVESKSRLLRSDEVLPEKEDGSERDLHATRGNPHTTRGSFASTECLQPTQDTLTTKESTVENETLTITEDQRDKKETLEEVCEIREAEPSLKSTEREMHVIREENGVKMGSSAEIYERLTKDDMFSIVEKDQKEQWNDIKENQPPENNVFAYKDRAAITEEAPRREHGESYTFEEKEIESSKVGDTRSKDKEQTEQEGGRDSEHTRAGVNETKENEQEKSTSVKENMDLKGKGKPDSRTLASTEKESKINQILKLKDKVKDIFSMREHKAKEEVVEKQDTRQAKHGATQRQEKDHKQLSPSLNIETNKVKQEDFEIALEESIGTEKEFSSKIQDSMETVTKDNTEKAIGEQTVNVRHKRRPAPPVPPRPDRKREGQPSRTGMPADLSLDLQLSAEEAKSKTLEQEINVHPILGDAGGRGEESEEARNKMASPKEYLGEMPPLLYYAINDGESEIDTRLAASPMRESTPEKEGSSATSPNDLDEGGWVRCLIEYAKSQASGPRSNTSSPSTIMPTLFKVKDNTFRTSPRTKTIKVPLHRSFPEEFRLNSPRDSWSGSEKGEEERGRLRERSRIHSPREASVSRRGSRLRDTPVRSPMGQPAATTAAQEHRSLRWRHPSREREAGGLAAGAASGGVESSAANAVDVVEQKVISSLRIEETEGSKEPSEKSESVCSTSEIQPLGKPPPVLPKSEKALRRAKRLTNKRIKKAEADGKLEGKSRASPHPVRERRAEPPPPAETLPLQPEHNPPQAPQFCPEPSYTQPAPNAVTQSFPLTQRKLLQDPDSGQYFMVDMPVQVKTKMFFDPETGKYIQLPVQAPEVVSSRPPSMEILNAPYLLYPGFVPVPISSLPPRGSASQTPASEILLEDQETLQGRSAPCRQEECQQTQSQEAETYIEPESVPFDGFPEEPLYMEDQDSIDFRNMNAVSELDSFTVDNV